MEPISEPLDEGIKEVVELLRMNGVNTFTSCEGEEGHSFSMPTVRIYPDREYMDEDEIRIAEILSKAGYVGYYIKLIHGYQKERVPWSQPWHFIEVEFWSKPILNFNDFQQADGYIPPEGWL